MTDDSSRSMPEMLLPCSCIAILWVGEVAHDCTVPWYNDDWSVICESCLYRTADISYRDLPPASYVCEARGHNLWAWNRDHLVMMLNLLRGESITGHKYEWFATSIRREWIEKKTVTTL